MLFLFVMPKPGLLLYYFYRTEESDLKYTESCPEWAECCTEYGYCQPKVRRLQDVTDINTGNFPACLPNRIVIKLN